MDPEIAKSAWRAAGSSGGFSRGVEQKMKYIHVFGDDEELGMILVASDDNVYGVGYNGDCGLLGVPNRPEIVDEQVLIKQLCHQRVTRISVGSEVGAAITADGKIFHWGRDLEAPYKVKDEYDDDDGDDADVYGVHQPDGSHVHRFVSVECGSKFVAALTNRGQVVLWGLIDERAQPRYGYVLSTGQIKAFSCGMFHIAMLSAGGDVFTCGYGSNGQLGREWSQRERYLAAKQVAFEHRCSRVVQVACGFQSTLFLMEDGSVLACGVSDDEYHHLGVKIDDDDNDTVDFPERVVLNEKVTRIAATNWNPSIYAAVTVQGNIFTWGEEAYPWKVKNETQLLSAFHGASLPSYLGDVIQPRLCGTCGQLWPKN